MAEDNEPDDPARAFKDMAAEVAVLRRAVEAFGEQLDRVKPRNYDPTLGDMRGELQGVGKRLDRIEAAPGVKVAPEEWSRQMRGAGEGQARAMIGQLEIARRQLADTAGQLSGLVARALTTEQQFRWQLIYGGGGVVVGLGLCMLIIGVIGLLPAGWHMREKFAAGIMREDRWTAAEQIARSADPQRWDTMAGSAEIVNANAAAIDACVAAVRKTGRAQRCTIRVEAERRR